MNPKPLVAMALVAGTISIGGAGSSHASDHLDTPAVIADPRADIADVYAWTSPNGKQLNLVMTIVGHTFSDKLQYVLHIDSGKRPLPSSGGSDFETIFSSLNFGFP